MGKHQNILHAMIKLKEHFRYAIHGTLHRCVALCTYLPWHCGPTVVACHFDNSYTVPNKTS